MEYDITLSKEIPHKTRVRKPTKYAQVSKNNDTIVQILGVLMPVAGYFKNILSTPAVITKTKTVRRLWVRRVFQLNELGCPRVVGRPRLDQHGCVALVYGKNIDNMVGCYPTFVASYPKTRLCSVRDFCPFCYARQLAAYWHRVDDAVFMNVKTGWSPSTQRTRGITLKGAQVENTPGIATPPLCINKRFDVVERVSCWHLPMDKTTKMADGTEVDYVVGAYKARLNKRRSKRSRKTEFEHLLAAVNTANKLYGAIETVCVKPKLDTRIWDFQIRQLFLVPTGVALIEPPWISGDGNLTATQRRTPCPRRVDVVKAMARTFRYPKFLLDPNVPAEVVLRTIDARHNLRLVESYGVFRNWNPKERTL